MRNDNAFSSIFRASLLKKKSSHQTERYKEKRNREKETTYTNALNINPFERTVAISFACPSDSLREFF